MICILMLGGFINMTHSDIDQTSSQFRTNPLIDSYIAASSSTRQTKTPEANINTTHAQKASHTITTHVQKSNQTIIGVFESRTNAEQAVNSLRQQGFTNEEISIIVRKQQEQDVNDDDIADGTLTGGTLGGIGGLLLGAGVLAIPGIAPIIALAGGPIGAAVGGAIAGGITGGLIDWGIPAEESQHYEDEVIQGSILAIIRTDSTKVNSVAQILRQNGAKEVKSHN